LTYGYGLLLAFLTAFCWGIAPVLYKRVLREMGLWKANAFRGLGILTLLATALFFLRAEVADELLSLRADQYLILALIALTNNMVGDVFYFAAIRNIGVSLAAPITSSFPLAVAVISLFCFGEALSLSVLSGTLSIVAGLALLNIRAAEKRDAGKSVYLRGVLAAILAALCWAVGLSLNKHLTIQGVSAISITFWRGVFFSLMATAFLPLATRGEKNAPAASVTGVLAAACAGIVALVVGGWFFVTSLSVIPMNVATPIASSSPLIAAVIACAFMGESLRPIQWLGIVFVVVGAVAVGMR
jgi:drug/metabolite transporter (DMT)-like permease